MNLIAAIDRGLNGLPYVIPIHPNLVHFTIGLFIVAIAFDLLGAFYRQDQPILARLHIEADRSGFFDLGWWNLVGAAVMTLFTVAIGFFEILLASPLPVTGPWGLSPFFTMFAHALGGVLILLIILGLTLWRGLQRYRSRKHESRQVKWLYLGAGVLTIGLMFVQGEFGAHLGTTFAVHNTAANVLLKSGYTPAELTQASTQSPPVAKAISTFSPNLSLPEYHQVGQTLHYGVTPVLKLPDLKNWQTLLTQLNAKASQADDFGLITPPGSSPTITLQGEPLLQAPNLNVAQDWLYKLQRALL